MTLAELRAEVLRRIDVDSASPVFWSADDVDAALNVACAEWADVTGWNDVSVSVALKAGQQYYDLRRFVGTGQDPLAVRAVYCSTSARWLDPVHVREFDALKGGDWDTSTGTPNAFFVRGGWWLGLWPTPAADTGTLTVLMTSIPASLTSSDSPGFHADYHYALVEYAHYDLLAQDKETGKAIAKFQRFNEYVMSYRLYNSARASIDSTRAFGVGAV